jgi:hypothetical protein
MFTKLKYLILGDKRPIVRAVTHPVIGTLTYSDDDEAWLTDLKTSAYDFGFYISGDWATDRMWHCAYIDRRPAPHLVFSGLDQ